MKKRKNINFITKIPLYYEDYLSLLEDESLFDIDYILFAEHREIIITLGRSASLDNILLSTQELLDKNVKIFWVDRGGDVTLHSPGQLMIYPLVDISSFPFKLLYNGLISSMLDTLRFFGISAYFDENRPGIWTSEDKKLASVGLSIKNKRTRHGFALYVSQDLSLFSYINPCGFRNIEVSSISNETGKDLSILEVLPVLERFIRKHL